MKMSTYVYFIQQGHGGSIKIGVSDDPDYRCKQMQTATARPLRVIARLPCQSRAQAFDLERELHTKFSHLRMGGEWFKRRILKELKVDGRRLIGGTSKAPKGGLLAA